MKKKGFRILGHFEIYIHCNFGSNTNFNAPTKYAFFTFSDMGSSLSNYLGMAVTMKSAVRILELADIPDEIILKVFSSLDLKDLLNCGQVSKRFRSISHDEFLWQTVDLSGKCVSAAFIQFIMERDYKHIDLSNSCALDLNPIQHIFNNCVQLTELNLVESTNNSLKESSFLFKSRTPQLEKIEIGILYNEDPGEHVKILLERCNQLKELHLKYFVPIIDGAMTNIIVEGLKNSQYLDTLDLNLFSSEKTSFSKLLHLPVSTKLTNLIIRKNKETTRLKIELQSLNLYTNQLIV